MFKYWSSHCYEREVISVINTITGIIFKLIVLILLQSDKMLSWCERCWIQQMCLRRKKSANIFHLINTFLILLSLVFNLLNSNNSSEMWRSTHQLSALTFTHTTSNRRTSERTSAATIPFTTLYWIGRWLGVLTRALNPPLCLLKSEVVWMGMGQVDLKGGPPDGSYQANRETTGRERMREREKSAGGVID